MKRSNFTEEEASNRSNDGPTKWVTKKATVSNNNNSQT
jgi:hypothetical protein